jgi:hypothetical protein
MSVFVSMTTSKLVCDPDHLQVFPTRDAADAWFAEDDPEGADGEHPDHQHRVNRGPSLVRVICANSLCTQLSSSEPSIAGLDDRLEPPRRNQTNRKTVLAQLPAAPSCAAPAGALSTNGITDRESSQREFCNTIASIADVPHLSSEASFVPILFSNSGSAVKLSTIILAGPTVLSAVG